MHKAYLNLCNMMLSGSMYGSALKKRSCILMANVIIPVSCEW